MTWWQKIIHATVGYYRLVRWDKACLLFIVPAIMYSLATSCFNWQHPFFNWQWNDAHF